MIETINIKIETERLVLRNLKVSDVSQDYVDWLNNPEINKYLSCANTFQTMESCLAYVQSYQRRNGAVLIGIFLKEHGLHIGNLTFSTIDWHNKTVAIGISIGRKECMGKDLAGEALTVIVKHCFEQLGFQRLWAGINTRNKRALSLYMKCRFKVERLLRESSNINGEFQDSYIVSVLKTDLRLES